MLPSDSLHLCIHRVFGRSACRRVSPSAVFPGFFYKNLSVTHEMRASPVLMKRMSEQTKTVLVSGSEDPGVNTSCHLQQCDPGQVTGSLGLSFLLCEMELMLVQLCLPCRLVVRTKWAEEFARTVCTGFYSLSAVTGSRHYYNQPPRGP